MVTSTDKVIIWVHGEIKTPPFTTRARVEAGTLLRRLQRGLRLSLPHSRPMPSIGTACHELRINDVANTWRIIYRIDDDAIVLFAVFSKKSRKTPKQIIEICKQRAKEYDIGKAQAVQA